MLPCEFLRQIADKYGLSADQTDVFLLKFGSDKSDLEIIDACSIAEGTLRYRMGEVYKKFSINGKGTGKAGKLLSFLTNEYQKFKPSSVPNCDASEDNLASVVQAVRLQRYDKIEDQCGTLRMLNVTQPISLISLYTNVYVLEDIPSQQWGDLADLIGSLNVEAIDPNKFERFGLLSQQQQRILGLDAVNNYQKLMLLGAPGSGKTTFLQYIAIQANQDQSLSSRVPIFIRLRDFAEAEDAKAESQYSLLNYISQEFEDCGISEQAILERLLTYGKVLMLLDGLDEVPGADGDQVVKQARKFIRRYHKNQFIITCRTQSQKYRFQSDGFTEVEVASFNPEQVNIFAENWFIAVAKNSRDEGLASANQFLDKLKLPENGRIRELAVTPILLNLACWVYKRTKEFPSQRSQMYERGIDILIREWDDFRFIERDKVYKNLSPEEKKSLLSQVAARAFEKNLYFFDKSEVQGYIASYLGTLPDAPTDIKTLQENSEAVLQAISEQHGLLVERALKIYSFSHLTFQEYFTAKWFVDNSAEQTLVSYIIKKQWREVFLLAVGMMKPADEFLRLMKQRIDELVASDEKLQQFLSWVNQKSLSVETSCKNFYRPATVRAFYLGITRYTQIAVKLAGGEFRLFSDFALDHYLDYPLSLQRLALTPTDEISCILSGARSHVLDHAIHYTSDSDLQQSLQQLKDQLREPDESKEKFNLWWGTHGQAWIEELRTVMIKHRNTGHHWQFNLQQSEAFQQYYTANELLVDCLNSGCEVTPAVRQEIEDELLLPISEIEKRRQQRQDSGLVVDE